MLATITFYFYYYFKWFSYLCNFLIMILLVILGIFQQRIIDSFLEFREEQKKLLQLNSQLTLSNVISVNLTKIEVILKTIFIITLLIEMKVVISCNSVLCINFNS